MMDSFPKRIYRHSDEIIGIRKQIVIYQQFCTLASFHNKFGTYQKKKQQQNTGNVANNLVGSEKTVTKNSVYEFDWSTRKKKDASCYSNHHLLNWQFLFQFLTAVSTSLFIYVSLCFYRQFFVYVVCLIKKKQFVCINNFGKSVHECKM